MFRNQERQTRKIGNMKICSIEIEKKKGQKDRERENEKKKERKREKGEGRKEKRKEDKKMGQCPNDVKGEISIIKCISVDER